MEASSDGLRIFINASAAIISGYTIIFGVGGGAFWENDFPISFLKFVFVYKVEDVKRTGFLGERM